MSRALQQAAAVVGSPFIRMGQMYSQAAEKRPFTVGVVTTGIKTSAADLFAQLVMERRQWNEIDGKRHAAFCIFGFAYLGAFQYVFYTKVLTYVTEPVTRTMGHIASAPLKTLVDQAFHHPFMYFPSFYFLKYTLVQGEAVEVAMQRYTDELWPNCNALWKLWVPCQLVNFSVVPTHLQIPFVAGVSFVWTVILSMMRGSDTGTATVEEGHAAEAPLVQEWMAEAEEQVAKGAPSVGEGVGGASRGGVVRGLGDETPALGPRVLAVAQAAAAPPAERATPAYARLPVASMEEERAVEGGAAAASSDRGFAAAPLAQTREVEHPTALAAAASISEHARVTDAATADGTAAQPAVAAASIAEPLLGHCSSTSQGDVHAEYDFLVSARGVSAGALSSDIAAEWSGAAGLLHLMHPLAAAPSTCQSC